MKSNKQGTIIEIEMIEVSSDIYVPETDYIVSVKARIATQLIVFAIFLVVCAVVVSASW